VALGLAKILSVTARADILPFEGHGRIAIATEASRSGDWIGLRRFG